MYPENTFLAFEAACQASVQWIETDVCMLQDKTLIIFHDDRQGRTVVGDKLVAEAVWADFVNADAGIWRGQAFAGQKVPTLAELLAWKTERELTLNLEIKCHGSRQQETAEKLSSVLQQTAQQDIVISSFDIDVLKHLRLLNPDLRIASIHEQIPNHLGKLIAELDLEAVHLDHRLITSADLVANIHQLGPAVRVWTVNDLGRAEQLLDWGVDMVISDYADRLISKPASVPSCG